MITFSGQIEPDIQAKVENRNKLITAVHALMYFSILFLGLLIAWLCGGLPDIEFIEFAIGACVAFGLYIIINCLPTRSSWIVNSWDYTINFGSQTITSVLNHTKGIENRYKMSKVKKVVDYGDYYYVYFSIFYSSDSFVCQKNLLTEGTTEEFEELFKDKIIRKSK